MTDEVPTDILGQRLVLATQFLLVTLTKDTLSLVVGRLNILVGMILADGYQSYSLWQLS
jgi:hypothetical protein